MPKKKDFCLSNNNWLQDQRFSSWFTKSTLKGRAHCSICCKDFDISNMGVSGLVSHATGKKHSDIAAARKSGTGAMFFRVKLGRQNMLQKGC